jgi:hypothetical protein
MALEHALRFVPTTYGENLCRSSRSGKTGDLHKESHPQNGRNRQNRHREVEPIRGIGTSGKGRRSR